MNAVNKIKNEIYWLEITADDIKATVGVLSRERNGICSHIYELQEALESLDNAFYYNELQEALESLDNAFYDIRQLTDDIYNRIEGINDAIAELEEGESNED